MKRESNYIGTFKGFPLVGTVTPPARGTPEYDLITQAIRNWRKAGFSHHTNVCDNAALELEIERDHGKIVHVNTRC